MKKSVRSRQQNLNSNSNSAANTPHKQTHHHKLSPISCVNHHSKTATHQFYTQESQQILYYCQKCSIMLASQGFNVQRITASSSHSKNRLKQIKSFLKILQQNIKVLTDKYCETEQYLIESQDWHSAITSKVEKYFESMAEILQLQKYMCYNHILSKRSANEKQVRLLKEALKSSIVEIQGMYDDIENNLDAVEGVDYSIYSSIISGYQQKLDCVPNLLNNQTHPLIKLQINIPQIPNALYTLVDKICQKTLNPPTPFKSQYFSQCQSRRETESYKEQSKVNNHKPCSQRKNQRNKQVQKNAQLGFSFDSKQNASNAQVSNYEQKSQKSKKNFMESLDGYLNQQTIGNLSYEEKMEETDTLLIA